MDEENKVVQETTAPVEPEMEEASEVKQDASVTQTVAPQTSDVDAEGETSGEQEVGTPPVTWENDKRSMAEKIKALENEKNEYLRVM
jgi:hypothetical protein